MPNIQPYRLTGVVGRTARSLVRIAGQDSVTLASVDAAAEIEAAKIDGMAIIAARALQDIALLSSMEASLAQAVPHASGPLATIADLSSLAMADAVVAGSRWMERS
jgi:hypothetical protein